MTSGYYRYPTMHKNILIFTAEDDLWAYDFSTQTIPRRLTTQAGVDRNAVFSPNGKFLAFSGMHEGSEEVYIMCMATGLSTRLTYVDENATVVGWRDDKTVLFRTSAFQAITRYYAIHTVDIETSQIGDLPFSRSAQFLSYSKTGMCAMQRHGYREYAYWKRYRGGTAGQIWIDSSGKGNFVLVDLPPADCSRPVWVDSRVYFISDHEGMGNVYSINSAGKDLQRLTDHKDYYVRHLSTDGESLVYSSGGSLYRIDAKTGAGGKIDVPFQSDRPLAASRYVDPEDYLQDFDLHPSGRHVAVTSRGKALHMGTHEGATYVIDPASTGRFRLARWLHDGKRLIAVNDADGEERLGIYDATTLVRIAMSPAERASEKERGVNAPHPSSGKLGRVVDLLPSGKKDQVLVVNHRHELLLVEIKGWKITLIDRSAFGGVAGVCWSADGAWISYGKCLSENTTAIMVWDIKKKKAHQVTTPVLRDGYPSFDPDGKYLYFIRYGEFQPVWDTLHFDMHFPRGSKPYAIVLQADGENPFVDRPEELASEPQAGEGKKKKKEAPDATHEDEEKPQKSLGIDFEGIETRVLEFPVPAGVYSLVMGVPGKVILGHMPGNASRSKGQILKVFDYESKKTETLISQVVDEKLSLNHQWFMYADHEGSLRVCKAGEKPDDSDDSPSKKSGWIDMERLKIRIDPRVEWQQIFDETWRLQRDNFWVEDMSKIDWMDVYTRYQPLVARLGSRADLTDLLWEVQGELGTSHAYVMGGDEQPTPKLRVGKIGADFVYDPKAKGYRITKIYTGNVGKLASSSPLIHPGVRMNEGDVITEINGISLSEKVSPRQVLLYQAGHEVRITVLPKGQKKTRYVSVKPLPSETSLRYRAWVDANRSYVHKATKGKVGYVHIPDMGKEGFGEFHRGYLKECARDALIIDVRFNGGGSVSPLLLEKLMRQRLGYDMSRWSGVMTYPADSPSGAMVALTNEYAGSDGDIFSHCFKMLDLGPLIGKRTWGGVIGISPSHGLADRGMTTQPEYSFWFKDLGWSVENYGVDPDIEVEITPQDFALGKDPQLDRGISEALKELKKKPPLQLDMKSRPNLAAWQKKKA
ncbi:MAG: PDZ domain-containing protein [Alphaproteobacteria bacterium]|nr:MAG: PDZ domain-containing protein [Alphaproteobacteria bacterium]